MITTPKEVILSPFEMQTMPGFNKVMGHVKPVHVITEPRQQALSNKVVATSMYNDLKPGSSRVKICLWNLTSEKIAISAWCVMGQIQAANEVPDVYSPVIPKGYLLQGPLSWTMKCGWGLCPTQVVVRTLVGPQLILDQRFLPLIEPYLNRLTCQGAHCGLQRTIRRLQICHQSLWTCFLNVTWTWGWLQ